MKYHKTCARGQSDQDLDRQRRMRSADLKLRYINAGVVDVKKRNRAIVTTSHNVYFATL